MSDFTDTPLSPPIVPEPLPWERVGAGFGDLWPTFKLIVSRPDQAFARVPVTKAVGRALLYGLIVYWLSNAIGQLWSLAAGNALQEMLERFGGDAFRNLQGQQMSPAISYLLALVVSPIIFFIGMLIGSGVVHLMLLAFGGAPGGFTTTMRVNAYSASAAVAAVIPFLGGLISFIWWIVLLVMGLKAAHRISTGRAVGAVLVPVALCCVCLVVIFAFFATALMTALGHGGS